VSIERKWSVKPKILVIHFIEEKVYQPMISRLGFPKSLEESRDKVEKNWFIVTGEIICIGEGEFVVHC
jgi:hypothetical protein